MAVLSLTHDTGVHPHCRDTMSFATKLCHVVYADGSAHDVMKHPATDKGKISLPGEAACSTVKHLACSAWGCIIQGDHITYLAWRCAAVQVTPAISPVWAPNGGSC